MALRCFKVYSFLSFFLRFFASVLLNIYLFCAWLKNERFIDYKSRFIRCYIDSPSITWTSQRTSLSTGCLFSNAIMTIWRFSALKISYRSVFHPKGIILLVQMAWPGFKCLKDFSSFGSKWRKEEIKVCWKVQAQAGLRLPSGNLRFFKTVTCSLANFLSQ